MNVKKLKGTSVSKIRSYLQDAYKKSGRSLLGFQMSDTDSAGNTFETRTTYIEPRFGSMGASGLVFKMSAGKKQLDIIAQSTHSRKEPIQILCKRRCYAKIYIVELPAGATLKGQPENVQIDTAFLKATRKTEFTNNCLTVTETTSYFDAQLPAAKANHVSATFQKLQDHRDYSYIVQLTLTDTGNPEMKNLGQPRAGKPARTNHWLVARRGLGSVII